MAKKQVVISECDGCGKEVQFPLTYTADKYTLPSNWLHVAGHRNNKTIFERDLCEECAQPVLGAAGAGLIEGTNAAK